MNTPKNKVIIVTGLPRSGTSMMMRILEMGGIPCNYKDNQDKKTKERMRNIYGFFEGGKIPDDRIVAVKRFGHQILEKLADMYDCYFVFMYRDTREIQKSWESANANMVKNPNRKNNGDAFKANQNKSLIAVKNHKHYVFDYDEINQDPSIISKLKDFLPLPFDVKKAITAVDKNLYIKR